MKTEKLDTILRNSGFEFHREENGVTVYENKFTGLMITRRKNKIRIWKEPENGSVL